MMPERLALAALGLLALAGLGAGAWHQRGLPWTPARAGIVSVEGPVWDLALAGSQQLDVNTATAAQLERLPGVGPILARRILEARWEHGPFRAPADLARVPGMGRATLRAIAPFIVIAAPRSLEASDGTDDQLRQ